MGKYFGTDGFRGRAGQGLTADHAYRIGRFLGWYYGRGRRAQIVVGKDTRRSPFSGEMMRRSSFSGLNPGTLLSSATAGMLSYMVAVCSFLFMDKTPFIK